MTRVEMCRFSFEIDPGFVVNSRLGTEIAQEFRPPLAFFSWTMFSAVFVATGAAALIWFA
ncbi:MAG: hypothetical protein ACREHF_01840 [Rhizomicrobium sp.]